MLELDPLSGLLGACAGGALAYLRLAGRRPAVVTRPAPVFETTPIETGSNATAGHTAKPLLTAWERRALLVLRQQVPVGLYVCPQVRLADLVDAPSQGVNARHALGKIAGKSVDFAVIELISGRVVLVVELDDRTHSRPDRQARDRFVGRVLDEAGIRLKRVLPTENLDIREDLQAALVKQVAKED